MLKTVFHVMKFLLSRVGIIYVLLFIFLIFCVDLKKIDERVKIRRLNGMRPEFAQMIDFAKHYQPAQTVDWTPYKDYFERLLSYLPNNSTAEKLHIEDYFIAKTLLGYIYFYTGQEKKAISYFGASEDFNRHFFWSNYNLGVIYYKKGMYAKALKHLNQALETDPEMTIKFMNNSTLYRQIFSSNSFNFNLKDELREAFGSAYVLMAASLGHLQQYKEMLMVSVAAINKKEVPNQEDIYFYAALACLELKEIDKAAVFFNSSLSIKKDNPVIYLYLSRIYKVAGNDQKSQEALKISQEIHSKNSQWHPFDERVELRYF